MSIEEVRRPAGSKRGNVTLCGQRSAGPEAKHLGNPSRSREPWYGPSIGSGARLGGRGRSTSAFARSIGLRVYSLLDDLVRS